jgi:hypothetical protein
MMHRYSPFWLTGGALTLPLWAAKDAQIASGQIGQIDTLTGADDPTTLSGRCRPLTAHRDTFTAALVADVLAQARDDAKGTGAEAGAARAFLAELRGDLAPFAPSGPPPPRPEWQTWCGPYLAALWAGETNAEACRLAGVSAPTVFSYGKRTADFAEARNGLIEARRGPPSPSAEGSERRRAA